MISQRFFRSPNRTSLVIWERIWTFVPDFVPAAFLFQLPDCALSKCRVASQIVGINDCAHAAETVPGDGGNLSLGASRDSQSCDGGAAQIVERDAAHPCPLTGLAPGGAEAVRRPRFAVLCRQDNRRALGHGIEHRLERRADRNDDPNLAL